MTMNITFAETTTAKSVTIHAGRIKSPPSKRLQHRSTYVMEAQKGGGFILFGRSKSGAKIPVGWRGDEFHAGNAVKKLNRGLKP